MTSAPTAPGRSAPIQAPADVSDRVLTAPNVLSALRLGTVPFFVWLYAAGRYDLAVGLYAAGAWTDFLDGYIARRTRSITRLGQLMDPFADRVFIAALAIALVASGALALWVALVLVVRDVLVLAAWPLVARAGAGRIAVSFVGKTATASLLFGLTWLAWARTSFPLHSVGRDIGVPFVALGTIMYWAAGIGYALEVVTRMRARRATGSRNDA